MRVSETSDDGQWGWTPGRIIATLLLVIVVGFWIWAFSPLAPNTHPDELDERAFADGARPFCIAAADELDTLPLATEAIDMGDRADQIDTGTAIYRSLLTELARVAPPAGTSDRVLVDAWLEDYSTYLGDRDRHAALLRDGIDQAFVTTAKGSRQITIPIDEFAKGNRIADCVTPQDL